MLVFVFIGIIEGKNLMNRVHLYSFVILVALFFYSFSFHIYIFQLFQVQTNQNSLCIKSS